MALLLNELPEEKRRDVFTLLPFLDLQLSIRDNLFITNLFDKLEFYLTENIDWYGKASIKKEIQKEIRNFCKASTNSFTFHDNDKELTE